MKDRILLIVAAVGLAVIIGAACTVTGATDDAPLPRSIGNVLGRSVWVLPDSVEGNICYASYVAISCVPMRSPDDIPAY